MLSEGETNMGFMSRRTGALILAASLFGLFLGGSAFAKKSKTRATSRTATSQKAQPAPASKASPKRAVKRRTRRADRLSRKRSARVRTQHIAPIKVVGRDQKPQALIEVRKVPVRFYSGTMRYAPASSRR